MRVLIVGGYGFVGSHVAERFFKEGHHVIVLDNLEAGFKNNITFKHRSYLMDAEDPAIERVFRSNSIDLVVYCAGPNALTNMEDFDAINRSFRAFSNTIMLSVNYRVKKFIFISSLEVYQKNEAIDSELLLTMPSSGVGVYSKLCEDLGLNIMNFSEMDVISIRTSQVYGPGEQIDNNSQRIINTMRSVLRQEENVFEKADIIYVSDLAYAVFKATSAVEPGIFHVASSKFVDDEKLKSTLASVLEDKRSGYFDNQDSNNDVSSGIVINKAISGLDWSPIVGLDKGLLNTYRWLTTEGYKRFSIEDRKKSKLMAWIKKMMKVILPYLENYGLFLAVYTIDNLLLRIGVFVVIQFKLIYIIVMGVFYGFKHALIAAILCSILYIGNALNEGMHFGSMIYDTSIILSIFQYLLVAGAVGYIIDRKNYVISVRDNAIEKLKGNLTYVSSVLDESLMIKEELENRLYDYDDSFAKIYSVVSELNELEPEKILFNSLPILNRFLHTKSSSIYIAGQSGYMRRYAATGHCSMPKSFKLSQVPELEDAFRQNKMYINRELDPKLPFFALPVEQDNKIIAIVMVDELKFEQLNLYFENLFALLVRLISQTLQKAYTYYLVAQQESMLEGTNVYHKDAFLHQLEILKSAKEKLGIEFIMLKIEGENIAERLRFLSIKISSIIRETDILGEIDQQLYILLSNTNPDEAEIAIRRLEIQGFHAAICEV